MQQSDRVTRRRALQIGASALGAAVVHGLTDGRLGVPKLSQLASAADPPTGDRPGGWQIGCFNRPWGRWSYDEALDGIKAAGFQITGLLGDHKDEPFTAADASTEYIDRLKGRIESRGLKVIVAWLRTNHDGSAEFAEQAARKQIDHAHRLGVKYLLTVGVDAPGQFAHFYRVMSSAAAYSQDRQIQIVLKPHGGCSAAAEDILRCVEQVDHENFKVWFDAGNIIHYTGKDPAGELRQVAKLVTGFCAKDCAGPHGDVMLPFGAGKVNFKEVFAGLRQAEFKGPVMVECCGGNTLPEVTTGAQANREFLEQLFQTVG